MNVGRKAAIALAVAGAAFGATAAGASAKVHLDWSACPVTHDDGTVVPYQCTAVRVPADYGHPGGKRITLNVTKLPAADPSHRIGSLFVNPGGPGGDAVGFLQATGDSLFASLNQRFDVVAFDPRGAGNASDAIDCKVNQKTEGIYEVPFVTPENIDEQAYLARAIT